MTDKEKLLACIASLFWSCILKKSILSKVFDEDMLIRSKQTTPLQIFCKFMLYFGVIFKSMKVADDLSRGSPGSVGSR